MRRCGGGGRGGGGGGGGTPADTCLRPIKPRVAAIHATLQSLHWNLLLPSLASGLSGGGVEKLRLAAVRALSATRHPPPPLCRHQRVSAPRADKLLQAIS